jgi:internalin A
VSGSDGFRIEESPDGSVVIVTGDWGPAAEKALSMPGVAGLTLNYALGFRERSLDFLREWPIRQLTILARTVVDLSPVYRLGGTLEQLSVQSSPRATIDLRLLPWLTGVGAEWAQIADTVEYALGLNDLFVMSYSPDDLLPLQRNQALSRLRMKQDPRLSSLDGAQFLPALVEVGIFGARRLTDIDVLRDAPGRLQSLDLESCSGIVSLDALAGRVELVTLGIGDLGPIASLRPLQGMTALERLGAWGSTSITDGDLSPLLGLTGLKDLRMMSRKHYRPPLAKVESQLGLTR